MHTKHLITSLAAILLLFNSAANASMAMLVESGGEITGINNVTIGGSLYDATFSNVLTGSSTLYDQDFADEASLALLALFQPGGVFSSQPIDNVHLLSVVGFEPEVLGSTVVPVTRNIFFTAAELSSPGLFNGSVVLNDVVNLDNDSFTRGFGFGEDFRSVTYVDWTKQVSAVPVPAAAFMFAPAVLGFLGLRRRAKQA